MSDEGTDRLIVFKTPFTSPASTSAGYVLVADILPLTAGQGFTVQLDDRFMRAKPGVGIETQVTSVRHLVGTSVILANLSGGQLTDNLTGQPAPKGVNLFRFQLQGTGQQVEKLEFKLSGVQGIEASNLSQVKLYADTNGNGMLDSGETAVGGNAGGDPRLGASGSIRVQPDSSPPVDRTCWLADFWRISAGGDRLTDGHLASADVDHTWRPRLVTGFASTATHRRRSIP